MQTPGPQQVNQKRSTRKILRSIFLLIFGSLRHCRVVGESMLPLISKGDIIIYKPFKDRKDLLLEGSIVVVNHPLEKGMLIVKRISKINSSTIEILGDNEYRSIDSRQFGQVNKSQVKGIVETIISKEKLISFSK